MMWLGVFTRAHITLPCVWLDHVVRLFRVAIAMRNRVSESPAKRFVGTKREPHISGPEVDVVVIVIIMIFLSEFGCGDVFVAVVSR